MKVRSEPLSPEHKYLLLNLQSGVLKGATPYKMMRLVCEGNYVVWAIDNPSWDLAHACAERANIMLDSNFLSEEWNKAKKEIQWLCSKIGVSQLIMDPESATYFNSCPPLSIESLEKGD